MTTPKRPSDAELIALLRDAASELEQGMDFSDARANGETVTSDQCREAADALEAASAEPFEAKVKRARAVLQEYDPNLTYAIVERALRAVGVEEDQ